MNGDARMHRFGVLGTRGVACGASLLLMMSTFFVVGTVSAGAVTPGPALLQADAVDSGRVELAWTAVSGASQYTMYRDAVSILTANTLRTTDTAITSGSSHSYHVTATFAGVESPPSPTMTVTVPPVLDTQAPTSPTNLHTTSVGSTSASLAWSASSDDVGVIGYFVKLGPVLYSLSEGSTSTNIKYLKAKTSYSFNVTAIDASGKESAPAAISFKTSVLGTVITTAPSAPSLTATAYSAKEVDLSWSLPGASDLTGFLVYQGTRLLEDIPPNSSIQTRVLPATGLSAQTGYTFSVQAYNAAGQLSTASAKTVTTLASNDVLVARGPYVQRVDAQSARVVWRTNIPESSNLSYSDGVNNFTVQDPVLRTDHSVLIGPLPSLARITYTLNYPKPKSGNFATCSGSPANLALDAAGDMGGGSPQETNIANLIAADHPDLIAAMGDDVYPTGSDKDYPARFLSPYASALAGSAFFTTFGNHEYYSLGASDARRTWSQPASKSSFSFDCSGVHIAVVDNYQPYGPGTAQYNWLASDLAATTQPWKIVVMHVPPYNSSTAGPWPGSAGVLDPLFEKTGVQLVLSGHAHNYERTKVINGVTYMVDGGGGNGLNAFSGTPPSWSAYRAADYSYVRFKISPTQIVGTEVRQDGTAGDSFTIPVTSTRPDTVIDSGPASQTNQTSASFTFSSTQTPATFQCQLDSAPAQACNSGSITYPGPLVEGLHHFSVQATTTAGTDPTPATAAWTVDTTPPTAPVLTATASTSSATVNLAWTASTDTNGIAGYDITRNGSPLTSLSGATLSYSDTTGLANTTYTYQVIARDPAGNTSASNTTQVTTGATSSTGPALVQSAGTATSTVSTTSTVTLPGPSNAGGLLVLSAGVYAGLTNQIASVTDSAGNIWTRIGAYAVSGHNSDGEMWCSTNAKSVTTVTAHTSSATTMALEVQEFSGIATTGSLDIAAGSSNTSTTAASGSVTPTASNDLVVGFVAGHSNAEAIIIAPGYTAQTRQSTTGTGITSVITGFQVMTSACAQAMTGTFASAMYWAAGVATFKAG